MARQSCNIIEWVDELPPIQLDGSKNAAAEPAPVWPDWVHALRRHPNRWARLDASINSKTGFLRLYPVEIAARGGALYAKWHPEINEEEIR